MSDYVSMLRGVNVGGRKVEMQKIRELYSSMNLKDVRTYIQSGNILFDSPNKETDLHKLRLNLESKMATVFGFEIKVILRSLDQIRSVIKKNPFRDKDENFLHVTFLQQKSGNFPEDEMKIAINGAEDFKVLGTEVYLFCPNGYGRTKLNNTFFERKLGVVATTRNWRTVNAFLSV